MSEPAAAAPAADVEARRRAAVGMLTAWARVWSPLLTRAERRESWQALGLPEPIEEVEPECWRVFHAAVPAPPVPLLLHCLVGMDGAQAREDWLRAIHHLRLVWNGRVLPPDHLAAACEVTAAAVANDDRVLVRELLARYLDPWCAAAGARLMGNDSPAAPLVDCFRADLAMLLPR
jgi:hypothetical protein